MAYGDEPLFELLDASQAFCHELSERLTAATNYLAALRRLAGPGYGSAAQRLDTILDKVSQQLALAGPLVSDHRQVLRVAARQRAASPVQVKDRTITTLLLPVWSAVFCHRRMRTRCSRTALVF
jgi:hypothetical protein